ncbi:MAG: beta-ureidopropionase / N-carbamoyl-L-amino-acid hydrolase [Frankiales bacterium]|nr:beta-ureidopropionase / N-carbamoyl-L-amino-acid hydrolase [Frankiales bacterium]
MIPLPSRFDQLWSSLLPLGRHPETGGYRRYAWTTADAAMRAWFRDQAVVRGMTYEPDRNGNQWAWWGRPSPGAVVTGSHLDSVPDGGAFDGPLGVVSGFLAVDELQARGVVPARPIAVVNFVDEEGARFGVACVGSRLMTGVLRPEQACSLTDASGTTLEQAMTAAGVDATAIGRDDVALSRIGVFVELHVEQGRALADLDAAVGVGTAIWPHGRWRCSFRGEGNHAGTTRLVDRRDPMLPFAATVLAAREIASELGGVATFGRVRVEPNGTNAIASSVHGWLDARAPDDQTVRELVAGITAAAARSAAAHGVEVDVVAESSTAEVTFADGLRQRLSATLGGVPELATGAGHDAGILSALVPTAMLFVRNPTGVSHSPAEAATAQDCVAGVTALALVLSDLAGDGCAR